MRVFDAMLLLAFHLAAAAKIATAAGMVPPSKSKGTGVAAGEKVAVVELLSR